MFYRTANPLIRLYMISHVPQEESAITSPNSISLLIGDISLKLSKQRKLR